MSKLTKHLRYDFRGCGIPPTTGTAAGDPFKKKIVGSGTVTKNVYGLQLSLEATNEIQNVCVYNDDILAFDVDELISVEFLARLDITSESIAATSIAIGLASARNDALDSVASSAWFKLAGSETLFLESDDGTTDVDDYDSGADWLDGQWQRFRIDLASQTRTQGPPFLSTGGKSNIKFSASIGGQYGPHVRDLGQNRAFSLGGVTGGLQLFAQIQKTAATDVASLTIRDICLEIKDN